MHCQYSVFPVSPLKRMAAIMLAAGLLSSASAFAGSLVISQVYGGGGNAGATLKNDFVELFNQGDVPISLNGYSVQYASAAGSTWQIIGLPNLTLQPGQCTVKPGIGISYATSSRFQSVGVEPVVRVPAVGYHRIDAEIAGAG